MKKQKQQQVAGPRGLLDELSELQAVTEMQQTGKQRVLIVEDSSVIYSMIKQVLEFRQYSVDTAKDGTEALRRIQEGEDYHLVLMDLSLPTAMNGWECLRAIRALEDPRKASVPVIAVTGNAEAHTPQQFSNAGFAALHEKPVNFVTLLQLVTQHARVPHKVAV